MPLTDEQSAWMQQAIAAMGKKPALSGAGRLEQPLGEKYQGEERAGAWRYDQGANESDDAFNARAGSGAVTTRHYSEQETADNTLQTDARGRVTLEDGSVPQGQQVYAMNPTTGAIVVGSGGYRVLELGSDGQPTGNELPATDFVTDALTAGDSGGTLRVEVMHHSTMLDGAPVAAAGMMNVRDSKVTDVSNASGHYRPKFEHLLQAIEALMQSGAMLDDKIVDAEGRDVQQSNPRAFSAWQKMQAMQTDLLRERPNIEHGIEVSDDPMLSDEQRAGLAVWLEKCHKRLKRVEKAREILRKMGIGPSNRIVGQVQVVSASPGASDQAIRDATHSITLPAAEFLAGTARPGAKADNHPVRASAPREAVNAAFKAEADYWRLRPEDQQDPPAGTITESSIPDDERAARLGDLQAQLADVESELDPLASPAPSGNASGSSSAAPAGYGVVDAPLLTGDDDDNDADDPPPGQEPSAAASVAGYGKMPQAAGRADPAGDDGQDAPLPGPPAGAEAADGSPAPPLPVPEDANRSGPDDGNARDDDDGKEAALPNLPAGGAGYARVAPPD